LLIFDICLFLGKYDNLILILEVISECSITEWFSSTRVELEAILSAILVLQTGQKVNIFTDSQAIINSINYISTSLTNGKNKI
jgi:ribonuclease HI